MGQAPASLVKIEPLQSHGHMSTFARVVEVEHLGHRQLRLVFSDGLVRELDLQDVLTGILSTLDDDDAFVAVSVDSTAGTVCWPDGIELDPDVLHGDHAQASGPAVKVLREYRPQATR